MADYFDSAQSNIDGRKRATLEAMARAGTDGKKAYEDEIARIQAQKQQAITAALAAAAQRGAPTEMNDQLAQQIGSGYDRRSDDLRAGLASRDAGNQALQGANSAYFDQAAAAIPSMRARADRQLEDIRAKAAEAEQQRQQQLMLSQLQLQRAGIDNATAAQKAQAAAAKTASGGDLTDSELRTRLNGVGQLRQEALPAPLRNLSVLGVNLAPSKTTLARQAGIDAGLDPARVAGLLQPKPKAAAAPPKPTAVAHRSDVLARVAQHASPGTVDAVQRTVAASSDLASALTAIADTKDTDLAKNGVSRDKLIAWIRDYYSV